MHKIEQNSPVSDFFKLHSVVVELLGTEQGTNRHKRIRWLVEFFGCSCSSNWNSFWFYVLIFQDGLEKWSRSCSYCFPRSWRLSDRCLCVSDPSVTILLISTMATFLCSRSRSRWILWDRIPSLALAWSGKFSTCTSLLLSITRSLAHHEKYSEHISYITASSERWVTERLLDWAVSRKYPVQMSTEASALQRNEYMDSKLYPLSISPSSCKQFHVLHLCCALNYHNSHYELYSLVGLSMADVHWRFGGSYCLHF